MLPPKSWIFNPITKKKNQMKEKEPEKTRFVWFLVAERPKITEKPSEKIKGPHKSHSRLSWPILSELEIPTPRSLSSSDTETRRLINSWGTWIPLEVAKSINFSCCFMASLDNCIGHTTMANLRPIWQRSLFNVSNTGSSSVSPPVYWRSLMVVFCGRFEDVVNGANVDEKSTLGVNPKLENMLLALGGAEGWARREFDGTRTSSSGIIKSSISGVVWLEFQLDIL